MTTGGKKGKVGLPSGKVSVSPQNHHLFLEVLFLCLGRFISRKVVHEFCNMVLMFY